MAFPQLSGQTGGQEAHLSVYSIQRCGGLAHMGQWAVSVLDPEPLHLTVTLALPVRWWQGYLTSRLEQR
jgi:hypothetical protein